MIDLTDEERRKLAEMLAWAHRVHEQLWIQAALQLPHDFLPDLERYYGFEIVRGDRFAVVVPVEVR